MNENEQAPYEAPKAEEIQTDQPLATAPGTSTTFQAARWRLRTDEPPQVVEIQSQEPAATCAMVITPTNSD